MEIYGFADKERAGGGIEYKHRVRDWLSAYAKAEGFYDFSDDEWEALAMAGLRMRF